MTRKSLQTITKKGRKTFRSLPSLIHLLFFITLVLIAVISVNFEVLRVMRLGDLFIIIFAFMIGVNWYGQKMQDTGYRNGFQQARDNFKTRKAK